MVFLQGIDVMGCRCTERAADLNRAVDSIKRGEVKAAAHAVGHAGRTLVEDVKSGAIKRAIGARLATMRRGR